MLKEDKMYDKDQQLLKAQIKDFAPAMLNSFTTEFGKNPEVYKMLKQMYMIVFKEKQMDRLKGM